SFPCGIYKRAERASGETQNRTVVIKQGEVRLYENQLRLLTSLSLSVWAICFAVFIIISAIQIAYINMS
ncbi:MAG: hypothetical protein ACP5GR_06385, partial [Thermoplasmata archaeon]